jgi:hypothetical protein
MYGFSCDTVRDKTYGGSDLLTVKDLRNDLGHGLKSFEEVGRNYPFQELKEIARRAMRYIHEILVNIDCYLSVGGYLANPPPIGGLVISQLSAPLNVVNNSTTNGTP